MTSVSSANAQLSPAVYMSPASVGRRRLWFNDQKNSGRALYNTPYVLQATVSLDLEVFRRSVREVLRHGIVAERLFGRERDPYRAGRASSVA